MKKILKNRSVLEARMIENWWLTSRTTLCVMLITCCYYMLLINVVNYSNIADYSQFLCGTVKK